MRYNHSMELSMISRFSRTQSLAVFLAAFLTPALFSPSQACTRVLFANAAGTVLVGDNMDWFEDMHTDLMVFPRDHARASRVRVNPMNWRSQYGSIIATVYGEPSASNGMNEHGFAAHLQGLNGAEFGDRDEQRPGLSIDLWAQFYLDNFQTVDEAVRYTQSHDFQVVTFVDPRAGKVQMHLAMEDASGDSAIIEYVKGQPVIYHDKSYTVMTNDPSYDKQLENVKQYAGLGGDKPLPGATFPPDRFVRASFYLAQMSKPKTNQEAIFKLLSIMQNAGQPYGTNSPERTQNGIIFESIWRAISDLTNRVFYFNSTVRFNTFWVNLDAFNLEAGAPVMKLDLENKMELTGEVSAEFKPLGN